MTVTLDPSLFQTEPISNPIYPPPMITNSLGTLLNDKAPVDETIIFSLIFIPGKEVGSEPVLIII